MPGESITHGTSRVLGLGGARLRNLAIKTFGELSVRRDCRTRPRCNPGCFSISTALVIYLPTWGRKMPMTSALDLSLSNKYKFNQSFGFGTLLEWSWGITNSIYKQNYLFCSTSPLAATISFRLVVLTRRLESTTWSSDWINHPLLIIMYLQRRAFSMNSTITDYFWPVTSNSFSPPWSRSARFTELTYGRR